jgi:hypothetical protein
MQAAAASWLGPAIAKSPAAVVTVCVMRMSVVCNLAAASHPRLSAGTKSEGADRSTVDRRTVNVAGEQYDILLFEPLVMSYSTQHRV